MLGNIRQTHNQVINHPAAISGHKSQKYTNQHNDKSNLDCGEHTDSDAKNKSAKHTSAHLVCTEWVFPGRRQELIRDIRQLRVVCRQLICKDSRE